MMKVFAGAIFFAAVTAAQSDSDFSGVWKLNPARSEITSMPVPADTFLKVQQSPRQSNVPPLQPTPARSLSVAIP